MAPLEAASPAAAPGPRLAYRLVVSAFLVFHLGALLYSNLPAASPLRRSLERAWAPREYVNLFQLGQAWGMFAPDPPRANGYLAVRLTLRDGGQRLVTLPRMSQLPFWFSSPFRRQHKYQTRLMPPEASAARRDVLRYYARQAEQEGAQVATAVLEFHWAAVPPVGTVPDDQLAATIRDESRFRTDEIERLDFDAPAAEAP